MPGAWFGDLMNAVSGGFQGASQVMQTRDLLAERQRERDATLQLEKLKGDIQRTLEEMKETKATERTGMTVKGQTDIANIQGGTSRDVANISAGSATDVANIQGGTSRDVANIGATSAGNVAGINARASNYSADAGVRSAGIGANASMSNARTAAESAGNVATINAGPDYARTDASNNQFWQGTFPLAAYNAEMGFRYPRTTGNNSALGGVLGNIYDQQQPGVVPPQGAAPQGAAPAGAGLIGPPAAAGGRNVQGFNEWRPTFQLPPAATSPGYARPSSGGAGYNGSGSSYAPPPPSFAAPGRALPEGDISVPAGMSGRAAPRPMFGQNPAPGGDAGTVLRALITEARDNPPRTPQDRAALALRIQEAQRAVAAAR